jgi:hypothetical protein
MILPLPARFYDTVTLAAFEIQIQTVEPQPVCPCLRPVYVCHQALAGRRLDVSLVPQPAAQVELPPEAREAVIAHHENRRLIAEPLENAGEDFIHFAVDVADMTMILCRVLRRPNGMRLL